MATFKNDYQGGNFFEIFSAQGKDPTAQWKLQGAGIKKKFEREVKGNVYTLAGDVATTKMQIPKDLKYSLSLVQRYLIFQINVPKGGEFSIEIGVTDTGNNKRRLKLSTSVKEISSTPLHAKIPLTVLKKSMWVNCCCDMVSIVGETWQGQTFGKIDSLSISANCSIKRIMTMRLQPPDNTDDDSLYGVSESMSTAGIDHIPKQCQLPLDLHHVTQVINMHKIRAAEGKVKGERTPIDLDLSASGRRGQMNESFHIAFGTKIGKPPTAGTGRKSTSSGLPSHRESMRSSAGASSRDSYDPSARPTARSHRHTHTDRVSLPQSISSRQRLLSDPGKPTDTLHRSNNPLNESKSWSGSDMQEQKLHEAAFTMPHPPPRDSSAESTGRRRPKVRSGERQYRTPADAHLNPLNANSKGHHHTVSAPSISHQKHGNSEQREDNSTKSMLSPLRFNKLAPIDRKAQAPQLSAQEPRLHANKLSLQPLDHQQGLPSTKNHNVVPAVVWTSQSERDVNVAPTRSQPWYQQDNEVGDESVTDVIEAVKDRMGTLQGMEDSDEEDRRELIDSLENFIRSDDGQSSSEEEDSPPTLFQFSAPPAAAAVGLNRKATIDQSAINSRRSPNPLTDDVEHRTPTKAHARKGERPDNLPVHGNGAVYSPSAYRPIPGEDTPTEPVSGAKKMIRTEAMIPRPPDSPRVSSRPGSGRLRSRHGSRASNHSNRPTPDSSANGDELGKALANHASKLVKDDSPLTINNNNITHIQSNGDVPHAIKGTEHSPTSPSGVEAGAIYKQSRAKRIFRNGDDIEGLPSPRTSEQEPRIPSAGRRGGSANSRRSELTSTDSDSAKEDISVPYQVQRLRNSDRASPVSSRGSTRLSRKSLKEIPESDQRLVNAQHSSTSPVQASYEPTAYKHLEETFDEDKMLQLFKREQEVGGSIDEHNNLKRPIALSQHQYDHEVSLSDGEHSSDESFATMSVPIRSHGYEDEMKDTLERSDTRENSVFSPPIIIASQNRSDGSFNASLSIPTHRDMRQKRLSNSSGLGTLADHSPGGDGTEEEEELDLLYDPVLNCYYDPQTHKYYELA